MKSIFFAYGSGAAFVSDLMVYVDDFGGSGGFSGTSYLHSHHRLPMIWSSISSAPRLDNHFSEVFRHPHIQSSRGWTVSVRLSVSTLDSVRFYSAGVERNGGLSRWGY